MSSENVSPIPPIVTGPRGAMRWKYWTLGGLMMFVVFVLRASETKPLNYIYLTAFCTIVVVGALYQCREMWTLKAKRSSRWLGHFAAFGSAGVVALFLVLHEMKLFTWSHLYFEIPVALFCAVATAGAWLTEWRKSV